MPKPTEPVVARARSWPELEAMLVTGFPTGWVFRGHRRSTWPLESSIERYAAGLEIRKAEERVFELFRRRAHLYLSPSWIPQRADAIGWLSVMQHHGAPTRLLDWTTSPYVAAFFALEDATQLHRECAIWAIRTSWCDQMLRKQATNIGGRWIKLEDGDAWDFHTLGEDSLVFDRMFIDGAPDLVLTVTPRYDTQRLAMQQGVFLAAGNLRKPFIENLCAVAPDEMHSNVKKIVFSSSIRTQALSVMRRRLNITRETLFPGLDGFAQSLRQQIVEPTLEQSRALFKAGFKDYNAAIKRLFPEGTSRGDIFLEHFPALGED